MSVRDWIHGGKSDLVFLPFIHRFAARLEQVETRQMLTDAGILTRCLRDAQRLFGYDSVVNNFDLTLEAEACGCAIDWSGGSPNIVSHVALSRGLDGVHPRFETQGRVPVVLEATRRLRCEVSGRVSLLGGATGPLSLASWLLGDSFRDELAEGSTLAQDLIEVAGDVCIALSRRYCEAGVDGILVIEDVVEPGAGLAPAAAELRSPLRTLWNVTQYFGVPLVLVAKGCYDPQELQTLRGLPVDGLSIGSVACSPDALEAESSADQVLGLGIPPSAFVASGGQTAGCLGEIVGRASTFGHFLTSEWEVPVDTSPERLHHIVRVIAERRGH